MPDDVECFPEIDTAPQTGYNHSVTTAQFKFELCQAMGMPGVTAYLYASGTVLDEEIGNAVRLTQGGKVVHERLNA